MIPVPRSSQLVAVQALADALPSMRVSTELPDPRPSEHVVVSRIGGEDPPFGAITPRFLVEVYAATQLAAEELGERVQHTWLHLRSHGINWATTDHNLAPYDSPDPEHIRWQFTGSLQILL